MEDSSSGTLQDNQKVEISLIEDKEMVVDVDVAADTDTDADATSKETQGIEIAITGTETEQSVENKTENDVSESVSETFEPTLFSSDTTKYAQVDNILASDTVELELKEEKGNDFQLLEDTEETELPPSEDNNEISTVSRNKGLIETEGVEAVKDMVIAYEEKNVLSSVLTDEELDRIYGSSSVLPPTDVASKETLETSVPTSDESDKAPPIFTGEVPKGIEETLVSSTDEKVGEQSNFQESSSYESARESFQPSPNVAHAEGTSPIEQDKTEESSSTENPIIVPVTQRQHTSWNSCCGLFELLRHDDR